MHASCANICMHNNPLQVGDLFMLLFFAFLQTKCIFKWFKLYLLIVRLLLQEYLSIYVAQLCSKHTQRIVLGLQTANPLHHGATATSLPAELALCWSVCPRPCVCECAVAVAVVYSSMADCSKYTVEEAGFDISALKTSLIQYFRCRSRPSGQCCCSLPPRIREPPQRKKENTTPEYIASGRRRSGRGGCCCCCWCWCVRSGRGKPWKSRREWSLCAPRTQHFSCGCL